MLLSLRVLSNGWFKGVQCLSGAFSELFVSEITESLRQRLQEFRIGHWTAPHKVYKDACMQIADKEKWQARKRAK